MENNLGLDYESIKSNYSLSVNKLKQWFFQRETLVNNLKAAGVDLSLEEALDHFVGMLITFDMRKLYDFFDEVDIRVFITDHTDVKDLFFYYNSAINQSKSASSRRVAEQEGFIDAFKTLENKLKQS